MNFTGCKMSNWSRSGHDNYTESATGSLLSGESVWYQENPVRIQGIGVEIRAWYLLRTFGVSYVLTGKVLSATFTTHITRIYCSNPIKFENAGKGTHSCYIRWVLFAPQRTSLLINKSLLHFHLIPVVYRIASSFIQNIQVRATKTDTSTQLLFLVFSTVCCRWQCPETQDTARRAVCGIILAFK
jgi:hypothetical protein